MINNLISSNFRNKHILSVEQFDRASIKKLFAETSRMRKLVKAKSGSNKLQHKIMTALFYEPSSRTFSSHISAMQRLGGGVIPIHGIDNSSVKKGETLEDSVRVFGSYSDVIVIRHPETGSVARAAQISQVPVINAGDGAGEHPTQALLDLYTISNHFSLEKKVTIAMVGDLKYGRTVHSLSKLLSLFPKINIIYVSPATLKVPRMILDYIKKTKISFEEIADFDEAISRADVLYMTRVQKERFENLSSYNRVKNSYILDIKRLEKAKKKMIIMHPLPRINEITSDVDNDPRAVYFTETVANGMYLRMALLGLILTKR